MEHTPSAARSDIRDHIDKILHLTTINKRQKFANLYQAQLFREQTSLRILNNSDEYFLYPICKTSEENFGKHGIGLQLYFAFLKRSSWLFFILSILSIYPIYSNYLGRGFRSTYQNQRYTYFTLANQESVENDEISLGKAEIFVKECDERLSKLWIIDFVMSLSFLVFVYFYASYTNRTVNKGQISNVKISDFALEVKGFPPYITDEQVRSYFEPYGGVAEVYRSRNYNGNLRKYKFFYEVANQLSIDKKIPTVTSTFLLDYESILSRLKNVSIEKTHDELEVCKVFVVFNTISEKTQTLSEIKSLPVRETGFVRRKTTRRNFNFRLLLSPAPDPSDILWENLEYSYLDLLKVRIPIFFLTILIVLLSFTTIYVVKIFYSTNSPSNSCENLNINGWEDLESAKNTLKTQAEIICYCKQQKIDKITTNLDLMNFCNIYIKKITSSTFINFSISFCILIVNKLLKTVVIGLSKHERFSRKTSKQLYVLSTIFPLMFINTALSSLVANTNFSSSLGQFKGKYSYITRDWYDDVGNTITVTMIMSIFSPHVFDMIFTYPFGVIRRNWCYRRFKSQNKLNKFFKGPKFDISDRLAQVLVVIFTSNMYSSGMPFLNLTCFCTLVLMFWCDKVLVLRHFRAPPVYSYDLNQRIVYLLPFAVVLHSVFAIQAYGSSDIFPQAFELDDNSRVVPKNATFIDKITRPTGIANVVVIIISILLIVLLNYKKKMCRNKGNGKIIDHGDNASNNFNDLKNDGCFEGIDSYSIFANDKYAKLVQTMNLLVRRKRDIDMRNTNDKNVKKIVTPNNSVVECEEKALCSDSDV